MRHIPDTALTHLPFASGGGRRRLAVLLAAILLSLGGASCVLVPFPPLPPTTYRGLVVDKQGRPVEGAEVELARPGMLVAKSIGYVEYPADVIAKGLTGRDGRFVISTRSGYATHALVKKYTSRTNYITGYLGQSDEAGYPPLPKEFTVKVGVYD